MDLYIVRKKGHETAFAMTTKVYSTFFSACKAIAYPFELPLDDISAWLNGPLTNPLYLENDKFLFQLIPSPKES